MANKVQFIVEAIDNASKVLSNIESNVSKTAKTWVDKNQALIWASNSFAIWLAGVTTAGGFFVKSMIDEAAAAEQTKIAFTTMTWSAEGANKLIKDMVSFAAKTPFELKWLENETKKLLAYWFSQNDVLKEMKTLGDIAAGVWMEKLPFLTLAYWQVRAAWKLTWNELRQFTEAGVPMLEQLSKVTWIAMQDMWDAIKGWQIKFEDVQKALAWLSGEWWRFFNLMEKQSASFSGIMSNISDAWTQFLRTAGQPLLEVFKVLAKQLLEFVNVWLPAIIAKFAEWWWYLKEHPGLIYAIAGAITAMLIPALINAAIAMAPMLLAFGELILIGAAVWAAIYLLYTAWESNFLWIQDITKTVRAYLSSAFDEFRNKRLPQIVETLSNIYEIFKSVWWQIWWFLKPLVMDIVNFFRDNWWTIKEITSTVFTIIGAVISQARNTIYSIIKLWMQLLKWDWQGAWDTIKNYFKNSWDNMWTILSASWSLIKWIISLWISAVWLVLQLWWDTIKNVISSAWNLIVWIIQGAWWIIKAAVSDAINWILSFITWWMTNASNSVSNSMFQIQGAFSNWFNAAKNVVSSIMSWITSTVTNAVNWIISIINSMKNSISSAVSWVSNQVSNISSQVSSAYNKASSWISSAVKAVSSPFRALGWPVAAWQPYTVGERWMEVFIPNTAWKIVSNSDLQKSWTQSWWSISINFGNVTMNNWLDLQDLVDKIKTTIYDEQRKAKLWFIS